MDKYGVDQNTNDDKAKTAAKANTCPKCGKPLEKDTPAKKCPTCGTEPFERKEADAPKE